MPWKYLPAAVRIKSRHDLMLSSYSGIFLVRTKKDTILEHHVVFIYHGDDLSDKLVYVSTPHYVHKESLIWNQAVIVKETNVFESHNNALYDCIKFSVANGFNFFPLDTYMGNSLIGSLKIVQMAVKPPLLEVLSHFDTFYTQNTTFSESIVVRSCPFSDTNPSIFADFKSHGSICQVLGNDETDQGFLSDLKFLENMAGGVVSSTKGAVLGLVLGNLRKLNGDGDLTVILSWTRIIEALNVNFSPLTLSYDPKALSQISCVFPIFLDQREERISWGSCVFIDNNTLVTNLHVVDPFLQNPDIRCRVVINNIRYIDISRSAVIVPFKNLDLVFIRISDEQKKLIGSSPAKLGESRFKSEVCSVGYGLFYNDQLHRPLISTGHVSALKLTRAFRTGPVIPTMTIASSSCWNGSSGGGLFNSDQELVGIICSNAQVFIPSTERDRRKTKKLGNVKQTEKVPLFCLSIPIELVMACYDHTQIKRKQYLLQSVIDLWNLEQNVKDIYNRTIKL